MTFTTPRAPGVLHRKYRENRDDLQPPPGPADDRPIHADLADGERLPRRAVRGERAGGDESSATDPTAFGAAAAVSATKAVIGATAFEPGDTVFYNIVLTNNGTGTQLDNPGDEFTDVLPVGLTLVDATATTAPSAQRATR